MDSTVKKIFKDKLVGGGRSDIVLDNKIKGVFGEIVIAVKSEDKELYQQTDAPLKNLLYDNPYIRLPDIPNLIEYRTVTYKSFSFDLDVSFQKPTKINQIAIDIFWWESGFDIQSKIGMPLENVQSYADKFPIDARNISSSGIFEQALWNILADDSHVKEIERLPIITLQNQTYSSSFTYSDDIDLQNKKSFLQIKADYFPAFFGYFVSFISRAPNAPQFNADYDSVFPASARITLIGTDIEENTVTYTISPEGTETNAFQLPKNTLVTTESMINGIPLYQYRANKIINEWHDGKQTIQLTKVVNAVSDLLNVGDDAVVLNTREADFVDVNQQSIARNKDGTAKIFKVDSAEFVYDGSYKQILNLSEKKDGGQ